MSTNRVGVSPVIEILSCFGILLIGFATTYFLCGVPWHPRKWIEISRFVPPWLIVTLILILLGGVSGWISARFGRKKYPRGSAFSSMYASAVVLFAFELVACCRPLHNDTSFFFLAGAALVSGMVSAKSAPDDDPLRGADIACFYFIALLVIIWWISPEINRMLFLNPKGQIGKIFCLAILSAIAPLIASLAISGRPYIGAALPESSLTATIEQFPSNPLLVREFENGSSYAFHGLHLTQTNMFFRIDRLNNLIVKAPTEIAKASHLDIFNGHYKTDMIRPLEGLEIPSNFSEALDKYPEFRRAVSNPSDMQLSIADDAIKVLVHYLLIHRLHYERLKKTGHVLIPDTRFVIGRIDKDYSPLILQDYVKGNSLWEMYDVAHGIMLPKWRKHRRAISDILTPLTRIPNSERFDWNIKNFIFDDKISAIYYVDSKAMPMYFGASRNQANLDAVKRFVLLSPQT